MADLYVALVRRPRVVRAEDDWYPEVRETVDVIIEDASPRDTGLVDQHGVTIWRTTARERVGF